jgi:hypothetical protein
MNDQAVMRFAAYLIQSSRAMDRKWAYVPPHQFPLREVPGTWEPSGRSNFDSREMAYHGTGSLAPTGNPHRCLTACLHHRAWIATDPL